MKVMIPMARNLNINSIRNEIDMLRDLVAERIDILLISETKINASVATGQLLIPGFSPPFRKWRRPPVIHKTRYSCEVSSKY